MRYRQTSEHPGPGRVESLTIVPALPDGTLGGLLPEAGEESSINGAPYDGMRGGVHHGGARGGAPESDTAGGTVGGMQGGAPESDTHGELQDKGTQSELQESGTTAISPRTGLAGVPLTLIHGPVVGADWHQAARELAGYFGFHVEEIHVVGAEGLPDALHLIVWAQGEMQEEPGPAAARVHWLAPDELRRRVSPDLGMIPGGASAAWIVADVAATIARR
ncbi:MAG TPA: hypothetical protein VK063_11015 [Beutenbergiaceae bacterium]|nr:hypothetical protein [Beutenbergiaceae bacterium]